MNTIDEPASNCTQIPEFDGFDLYAAESRAVDVVAAARGVHPAELLDDDDQTVFNRVSAEANDLLDAAITEIRSHPEYRPTDPDFWDRVLDGVQKLAMPVTAMQVALAPRKADINSHKVGITFFQNEFASSLTERAMTLPELRDLILVTKGASKGALPWLKGARFGNKRTDADSLRSDENVIGFDLIELDYDKEAMSLDEAIATIKEINVRALIYSTPSHTPAAPRWQILLPVSRPDLALETRAKLCARVNGRFGGIFAKNPSRCHNLIISVWR